MTLDDLQKQVNDLQKQIDDIRQAKDVVFTESAKRRVFQNVLSAGVKDTTLTGINQSVGGTDAFTSARAYTARLRIVVDGNPYYIGLY